MLHMDTYGYLPTGGQFYTLGLGGPTVDASGAPVAGKDQRWGWKFQLMPFLEQATVVKSTDPGVIAGFAPPTISCPSKRPLTLYGGLSGQAGGLFGEYLVDYAGNGGDTDENGKANIGLTPESPRCKRDGVGCKQVTGAIVWYDPDAKGLASSTISSAKLIDGSSKTMLVGEKYVHVDWYRGGSWGDNVGWPFGFSWDNIRFSNDTQLGWILSDSEGPGTPAGKYDMFGAAHPAGMNAVFCDGSVHMITYDIEHLPFQMITNRKDGHVLDGNAF